MHGCLYPCGCLVNGASACDTEPSGCVISPTNLAEIKVPFLSSTKKQGFPLLIIEKESSAKA